MLVKVLIIALHIALPVTDVAKYMIAAEDARVAARASGKAGADAVRACVRACVQHAFARGAMRAQKGRPRRRLVPSDSFTVAVVVVGEAGTMRPTA